MRRLVIAGVAVGVLLLASGAVAAASGWSIQPTPIPTNGSHINLNGVSCASARACTAVGSYTNGSGNTVTLAERWNGSEWSIQPTPNPTGASLSELEGVSCASARACTAAGSYLNGDYVTGTYVTLAERWNGSKWSIQHTPNPTGSPNSGLNGVSCASARACTAVGSYLNGDYVTGAYVTLAERWNGSKWSIQHTPKARGDVLEGVSCASARACIAVGGYPKGTVNVTLAERWNGSKWSIQHTPNPTGSPNSGLNGVSCASARACTAVGSYGNFNTATDRTLAERWNGSKWSIEHTPKARGDVLEGVSCASAHACTAVGYTPYVTLAERWNASKWSIQPTPNPTGGGDSDFFLGGVSCASARACTAVGDYFTGAPPSGTSVGLAERWTRRG